MQRIASAHLLNLISSAYPGLVTYSDRDYRFIFVNKNFEEWFGIDSNKVRGVFIFDVIGEEEFKVRKASYDKALAGEIVKISSRVTHMSLGVREVDITYYPDKNESGEIIGFLSIGNDVTEQKRAEKVAQDNEARFRSLTEVMPQLIWIVDSEGRAVFFNQNWPRVTGTTMEENYGNGWINVIHPDDRVNTALMWNESLKNISIYEVEYRLRMTNGTYRWHMARGVPIKNDEGKIERWVGTTTDIEAQKNARVLADNERERFYSLFMQSPIVICVLTGPEHYLNLVNPPAKSFFGNRELKGLCFKDALPELEEQGYNHLMDEVYHSGKGCFLPAKSISIKQLDGTFKEYFHDLFCEPIKDENGLTTGILNMSVDVTEQVKALKQMEEALKSRDQFLSVASHELKTPLTSLKLQSQLILRTLAKDGFIPGDRQLAQANQMNQFASKLTRLIDDMLDVSRIKTGKLSLDCSPNEIGDIVREVVFNMSLLFEAAGLQLPSIVSSGPIQGDWDRFRLEQVISNLLTNAIRYGRGKAIEIVIKKVGQLATIAVTDHGYGIAQGDVERIFGRFERAIDSSEVSGLGLGLFISKEIIEAHGGRIFVKSKLGEGSTFTIELPAP